MSGDIRAMLTGLANGRQAFQGMLPSASNTGGAPPGDHQAVIEMLTNNYKQLSDTIEYMNQTRRQIDANKLLGALKIVSGLKVELMQESAEEAKEGAASQPNINAQGIVQ